MATRKSSSGQRSPRSAGAATRRPASRGSTTTSRSGSKSQSKRSTPKRPPTLREQLEVAARGLLYMSESDYPLRYFSLPRAEEIGGVGEGEDLSPEGFLTTLGVSTAFTEDHEVPIDELVQEQTLDDFLELVYKEGGETGRMSNALPKPVQKLQAVLEHSLRGVKVIRVGTVAVRCYVAGIDERGDIAGLVTTSIET